MLSVSQEELNEADIPFLSRVEAPLSTYVMYEKFIKNVFITKGLVVGNGFDDLNSNPGQSRLRFPF